MEKTNIIRIIKKYRLIPLIDTDKVDSVLKVTEILRDISLPIIEITLRTKFALDAIKKAKKYYPDVVIGAGTVIEIADVKAVIEAGSDFIVTPGLDEEIVKICLTHKKVIFPGVATASEIQRAYRLGLKVMKFFPAELAGGVKILQALDNPFSFYGIKFIPLGGVNKENFLDYLKLDNVLAVGGSFIIDKDALEKSEFGKVKRTVLFLKEKLQEL